MNFFPNPFFGQKKKCFCCRARQGLKSLNTALKKKIKRERKRERREWWQKNKRIKQNGDNIIQHGQTYAY